MHRDSIGSVQTITPGAVNLMVAGRGIVHSERTGPELRAAGHQANGLQLWHALPEEREEMEPVFRHHPAAELPRTTVEGVSVRVMIGAAYGLSSPVRTFSPTLYAEASLPAGSALSLPEEAEERAVYPISGSLQAGEAEVPEGCLTIFGPGEAVRLTAREPSRIALIGGAPLGQRFVWWNFVSSRRERIEAAKSAWKENRMGRVPGERERYRLPERDAFFEGGGRSFG